MRDPHFRWQAGSSLPCHSFHRMWVSGASITTLNHKKRALVLSDVQCILNVPPSWSFLNGLLNHVVKELNVEEALKLSILVVHKAAAVPLSWSFLNGLLNHVIKELNVVEVIKSPIFVVTSRDVARGLWISTNQRPENYLTPHTDTQTHRESTCWKALLYEQRLQKGLYF